MELLEAARRADYWDKGVRPNVDTFSTLSKALNYRDVDTEEYMSRLNPRLATEREYQKAKLDMADRDRRLEFANRAGKSKLAREVADTELVKEKTKSTRNDTLMDEALTLAVNTRNDPYRNMGINLDKRTGDTIGKIVSALTR